MSAVTQMLAPVQLIGGALVIAGVVIAQTGELRRESVVERAPAGASEGVVNR